MPPLHLSRFAQLLLLSLIVLFLPTFIYLWPTRASAPLALSSAPSTQGSGPLDSDVAAAAAASGAEHWTWPEKWVDPARLKAGDYWKTWKDKWSGAAAEAEAKMASAAAVAGAVVTPASAAVPLLPVADGKAAIADKMGNATAKAELGRATWKFLHTLTLRYPEKPTPAQRTTLSTFFHSFSLLYPCGECANHFQQLLQDLPPQTSSRRAASMWLCAAHNRVNARLGKPEFACDHLEEHYDCGCGDEGEGAGTGAGAGKVVGPALPPAWVGPTATPALARRSGGEDELEELLRRGADLFSCR